MVDSEADDLLRRAADASSRRRALDYLDAADRLLEGTAEADRRPTISALLRVRSLRALGRLDDARDVLDTLPRLIDALRLPIAERLDLTAASRLEAGMVAFFRGDLHHAGERLRDGLEGDAIPERPDAHAEAEGALALAAYLLGHLATARQHHRGALAAGSAPAAELAGLLLALETGRADDLAERAASIGDRAAGTEYEAVAWCVEAHALVAFGDHDGALARLWRLGDPGAATHPPLTRFLAMVGQLEVLTARHEFAAALGLLRTVEADADHAVCPASWEARVLLETGDFARAIALTEPCLVPGRPHAARTLAYAHTVHAAALAGIRDLVTADAVFQRALSLASVTGLRRHLVGLPPSLLSLLLSRAAAADLPASSHAVVLDIVGMLPTESRPVQPILSARERLVLEHLSAGEPLQRVAWLLSVSPNTVKAQARSIYRKLGVDSRESAVQRGRSLGLLG
jgi:LuxR family maltose regulon positive regulatory protein